MGGFFKMKKKIRTCNDVSCMDNYIEEENIPAFLASLDKEIEVIMEDVE